MASGLGTATALASSSLTLTFDEPGFLNGQVISTTDTPPGATLTLPSVFPTIQLAVDNVARSPDLAVIFDTSQAAPTQDPDLLSPFDMGNAKNEVIGNLLIIQEGGGGPSALGDIVDPDDEGRRPAGVFTFTFDTPIFSLGFDLVDVEETGEFRNSNGATGFFATFFSDSTPVGSVTFEDFVTGSSLFFDSTVEFGNNSLNRIAPISAPQLNSAFTSFDVVKIGFGGSGGLDNLTFTTAIPSPTAVGTGLIGTLGLVLRRRRRYNAG